MKQQHKQQYALNCKKGGLVKHGHDQHRDHCAAMAKLTWGRVGIEPIVRESDENTTALYADFVVNGVWESGRPAFFDNRIVNADAASYQSQSWTTTSNQHSRQKHEKYDLAAEDSRGSFTPLVCSSEGVMHKEYETYIKRMALILAHRWGKSFGQVLGWVKVQEEISIIRAVSLRLRGSRRKIYGGLRYEDGAALVDLFE